MSYAIHRLLPLLHRAMAETKPLVLGTVVDTSGSTYTKAGGQMLIAADGETAGLLSGGCLEADLVEHARALFAGGSAKLLRYEAGDAHEQVFGFGSGCEGTMEILLQPLDPAAEWQPFAQLAQAWQLQQSETLLLVVRSAIAELPAGSGLWMSNDSVFGVAHQAPRMETDHDIAASPVAILRNLAATLPEQPPTRLQRSVAAGVDLLVLHQNAPVRILILGAGPDARPVAHFAEALGWRVTIVDHRSQYARRTHFPGAAAVLDGGPASLAAALATEHRPAGRYLAAVVMSHHLEYDRSYLRGLAQTDIPYVGLLGPPSRCERLLHELGDCAVPLRGRLRAPVGLDLGAMTPEGIALSIVAEIHATLAGRSAIVPMSAWAG